MTKPEFDALCASVMDKSGLKYAAFPQTYLINAIDCDGVTQSYYASTGTAIFRDGDDWRTCRQHTERNMTLDRFVELCKGTGEDDIVTLWFSI